ncbi:hypothetical protein ACQEU8_00660 [Streptomyces sp. CA-250714]
MAERGPEGRRSRTRTVSVQERDDLGWAAVTLELALATRYQG